jgi:hypothetical protein
MADLGTLTLTNSFTLDSGWHCKKNFPRHFQKYLELLQRPRQIQKFPNCADISTIGCGILMCYMLFAL